MKYTFLILLISISNFVISQKTQGIALYNITVKLNLKGMSGMNFDFPEETTSKRKLTFKDSISIFEIVAKEQNLNQNSAFNFHFIEPENNLYINRSTSEVKEQKDFMGKIFLIESAHEPIIWHKTSEVKKNRGLFLSISNF